MDGTIKYHYHFNRAIVGIVKQLERPQNSCSRVIPLSKESIALLLTGNKTKSDRNTTVLEQSHMKARRVVSYRVNKLGLFPYCYAYYIVCIFLIWVNRVSFKHTRPDSIHLTQVKKHKCSFIKSLCD